MSLEEKTILFPWLGTLTRVMDVGILIINGNRELEFASSKAAELLWCRGADEVRQFWARVRPRLADALVSGASSTPEGTEVALEVDFGGRHHQLLLEVHEIKEEGCEAFLILLKDRESIDSLLTDLRLATQFRNMGRLYRAMAHDLRHPVAAISVYLQLLGNTLQAPTRPRQEVLKQQAQYLAVIRNEMEQLDRSLQFLLQETSASDGVESEFDLCDLVVDLVRLIEAQAKQQRVAVEMKLPEQPVHVRGHRDRLKQAILNIAVNALDAMTGGGQLTVRVAVEDGWAAVVLRDTGPGIAADTLPRIFDMHFTTKTTGTGVGLYVARQIARSHGGDIGVETRVGEGSVFRVNLPVSSGG